MEYYKIIREFWPYFSQEQCDNFLAYYRPVNGYSGVPEAMDFFRDFCVGLYMTVNFNA